MRFFAIRNLQLINDYIIIKKYNFINNTNQLYLVYNNSCKGLLFNNNCVILNKFENKRNYKLKKCALTLFETPHYLTIGSFNKSSKLAILCFVILLKNLTLKSYLGAAYKLEIAGYSRRSSYLKELRLLYLRLGQSFVNIKKISSLFLVKLIKMRVLFFYSLNINFLKIFIINLIKLKPTSVYKTSGLLYYNSFVKLKKRRAKAF